MKIKMIFEIVFLYCVVRSFYYVWVFFFISGVGVIELREGFCILVGGFFRVWVLFSFRWVALSIFFWFGAVGLYIVCLCFIEYYGIVV